jgi:D-xylose transport system permease protein
MKDAKGAAAGKAGLGIDIRTYAMIGTLALMWTIFEIITGGTYLSSRNVSLLVRQTTFVAMLTTGVTLVIVNGMIDLSLGSVAGLASGIAALLTVIVGMDVIPAILVTLAVAAVIGLIQGECIARFKIPAFIVTLGGFMIFRGILLGITMSRTIAPLPPALKAIGQGYIPQVAGLVIAILASAVLLLFQIGDRRQKQKYGFDVDSTPIFALKRGLTALVIVGATVYINQYQGLPVPVLIVAAFATLLTVVSRKTKFGRHVYASGGNQEAARLSGIDVERVTVLIFVICAIYTAIGGIILAARLNAGTPSAGSGAELDAIAAAVIGGTSLVGGIGSIPGALIGALVMGSLDNGLSLLNVEVFYQMIIKGLILVVAVGFDINAKR